MRIPPPLAQLVRGFCIGSADIVPGVSGGTIALVLGIYERLVDNIHRCAQALKQLLTGKIDAFVPALKRVEWVWLISLLAGILVAIVALSSVIERLLDEEAIAMGGLFTGLVLASAWIAFQQVRHVETSALAITLVSAVALFFVLGLRSDTGATGAEVVTEPLWAFFGAGALAICAMILPGVSGSFVLVLLGMYTEVLGAVNDRDLVVIGAFGVGAIVGLSLFSTLLNHLLERYHDWMLMAMVGLMLGSVRVLWPWPNGTHTTTMALPRGEIGLPIVLTVVGAGAVLMVQYISTRFAATDDHSEPVTRVGTAD